MTSVVVQPVGAVNHCGSVVFREHLAVNEYAAWALAAVTGTGLPGIVTVESDCSTRISDVQRQHYYSALSSINQDFDNGFPVSGHALGPHPGALSVIQVTSYPIRNKDVINND